MGSKSVGKIVKEYRIDSKNNLKIFCICKRNCKQSRNNIFYRSWSYINPKYLPGTFVPFQVAQAVLVSKLLLIITDNTENINGIIKGRLKKYIEKL